ncbi:Thioredoxin-like protein 1 [Allomyces javanicus]|nr:Thioredoxin-like protein 1 [Allomyces javanicus]
MVKQIKSGQEFAQAINSPQVVRADPRFSARLHVEWTTNWKTPFFAALEPKFKNAQFIKVDVDELRDVAQQCGISAMPTFQVYRAGKKLGEMRGANPQQLEMLVRQHAEGANARAAAPSTPYIPPGHKDITDLVDQSQVDCLNQKGDHSIKGLLKGTSTLESDVDEQLMINVAFQQTVKLHSIKFVAADHDTAPKTIKLFVNRVGMGFDSVDAVEPTQVLELTEEDYAVDKATALRFVKFQSVNNLSIFVEENFGGDELTVLKGIKFIGVSGDTTNMADLKKMGHEH